MRWAKVSSSPGCSASLLNPIRQFTTMQRHELLLQKLRNKTATAGAMANSYTSGIDTVTVGAADGSGIFSGTIKENVTIDCGLPSRS